MWLILEYLWDTLIMMKVRYWLIDDLQLQVFICDYVSPGGRIRATVAQITFDEFHRNSMQVIQHAVFGPDLEADKKPLKFPANNLVSRVLTR